MPSAERERLAAIAAELQNIRASDEQARMAAADRAARRKALRDERAQL